MDGVVAAGLVLGRGVAQHELGAQFFGDLGINVIHRVFLFDLKVASPGLLGNFLKDFLAVGAIRLPAPAGIASPWIAPAWISSPGIATSRVAAAHAAAPAHALVVIVIVVLVPSDIYRVNDGFGLLGRLDGAVQGLLAAPILPVGQDNDGLATGLLLGNFIAGEKNRVVKQGAGAALPVGTGTLVGALDALDGLLGVDKPYCFLQLGVIRGQVLKQLDFAIEMDHKGTIGRPRDHLVEEAAAGAEPPVHVVPLAHAGVDQQSHGQG